MSRGTGRTAGPGFRQSAGVACPALALILFLGATLPTHARSSDLPVTAPDASAMDATINRLADELYALRTQRIAAGTLPDNSDAALRELEQAEDDLYARLMVLDAKALTGPDAITAKMLRETLEADRGVRVCRRELWNVDHIGGWHIRLGALAQRQPVGSAEARANAIRQWRLLPRFVDVEIARLELGLKLGYSAPRAVVSRVIMQLDAMLAVPVERSPFLSPQQRDTDPAFATAIQALVTNDIYPALNRYREFLRKTYLARARSSLGVSFLPEGKACYRALLRRETTLDSSPREIFDRGQAMIEANRTAIIELGKALFGSNDLDAIMRRLMQDPDNKFRSAAEVLEFSQQAARRARELSTPLFFAQPETDLQIVAFPAYQRNTGMNPYYSPASPDGKPAQYLINLETWNDNSKGQAEVATIHEAWPGHHLQVSIARSLPRRNQFTAHANYAAYTEGWARYVERLADETGMYSTRYARITWRAKPGFGMVVDPGLHEFGWSRERAAAYLKASGLFNGDQAVEDMIDRIAVMPAQLTAYDTGGSEFLALREQARQRLGDDFDLRRFHQQVLSTGSVPLSTLRELTTAWLDRVSGDHSHREASDGTR